MDSSLFHRVLGVAGKPVFRRTALALVLFVALFGAFGYLVLPGIIKSQAEQLITAKLQRQISIEKIEVSPYALAVSIHGLKLMEADGAAVFAGFDEMAIDTHGGPFLSHLFYTKLYAALRSNRLIP